MDFLLFKVIPVLLLIMLGVFVPHEQEISWKTVVTGFAFAITTFNFIAINLMRMKRIRKNKRTINNIHG